LFCFVLSAFICMLCIFMTYSTSYFCHYKLRDLWNICMYVCMRAVRKVRGLTLLL
jgi:hypothetical protein